MSAQILDFPTRPSRLALRLEWFATERSVLLAIWALYFALRVAVLFVDVAPSSDAEWYYLLAANLAGGHGYVGELGAPTAFWPPGWPLALGFAFSQFGASPVTLGVFNLVCSLLIGLLTLALGRRLFASEAAARLALLLLAIYPNAIGYVPLAQAEVFYTLLLMAGCWAVIARENRWQLVGAGLVFGFATLVKAQTLVLVPLLFRGRLAADEADGQAPARPGDGRHGGAGRRRLGDRPLDGAQPGGDGPLDHGLHQWRLHPADRQP